MIFSWLGFAFAIPISMILTGKCACVCVRLCACMCACVCTICHMCVYMCVCLHVCVKYVCNMHVHICMCVCLCVYMFVLFSCRTLDLVTCCFLACLYRCVPGWAVSVHEPHDNSLPRRQRRFKLDLSLHASLPLFLSSVCVLLQGQAPQHFSCNDRLLHRNSQLHYLVLSHNLARCGHLLHLLLAECQHHKQGKLQWWFILQPICPHPSHYLPCPPILHDPMEHTGLHFHLLRRQSLLLYSWTWWTRVSGSDSNNRCGWRRGCNFSNSRGWNWDWKWGCNTCWWWCLQWTVVWAIVLFLYYLFLQDCILHIETSDFSAFSCI